MVVGIRGYCIYIYMVQGGARLTQSRQILDAEAIANAAAKE